MANMDVDSIIKDLDKRFAAPLPELYSRRIIFWHDEEAEFADRASDIELALDSAKLVILSGTNNFAIKKLLSMDDLESNYLVYCPLPSGEAEDDWLLNIKLYSEEFRADLISIWMSEMGLDSTPEYRRLTKQYKKFFGAQVRRASFAKLSEGITTSSKFHLAIMAAITGARDLRPSSILRAVLAGGIDTKTNDVYGGLASYGADEAFWALISKLTGYDEGVNSSIERMITHILLTASTTTLRGSSLAGLDSFISPMNKTWCYEFASSWIAMGNRTEIRALITKIEDELSLRNRFARASIEEILATDIFPCIDECILTHLMNDITNRIIDTERIIRTAEKRRTLAWYDEVKSYYQGIVQLANMHSFSLAHQDGYHKAIAHEVWKAYTDDYYLMDSYYRYYHLALGKALTEGSSALTDLLKQVTEQVEGMYRTFLGSLGANWTSASEDQLHDYGRILEVSRQEDFYNYKVKDADSRVYVIISDALRYEVAASLAGQLRQETQSKVELGSCSAIFPTVTKYGMAALLPHDKLSVQEGSSGIAVLADGVSTDSGYRDRILKSANSKSVALKYTDIAPMKRVERSALVHGMDVVYIYHDTIDAAGHDSVSGMSKVFPACDDAMNEIKSIIKMVCYEFGGTHIYVTADHGFLYTYSALEEYDKLNKSTESSQEVEVDRRYLITRKGANPDYLMKVKFFDDSYDAYATREYVRIKKKGGNLNFVHGGISLQEMVVPVIDYRYLRNDNKSYQNNRDRIDTKPVTLELISSSRKISNMSFSLSFYQTEAVSANRSAASYLIYMIDATGRRVSDIVKIIANKTSPEDHLRGLRSSFNLRSEKFDNRASYYLVIADESGEQELQRIEFQIDIAATWDEYEFM